MTNIHYLKNHQAKDISQEKIKDEFIDKLYDYLPKNVFYWTLKYAKIRFNQRIKDDAETWLDKLTVYVGLPDWIITEQQIEEDGTTIFEDMHGNVLQINPDGSRSATNKVDGTQTDVLEDGTVIVERNGRVIQKENDGTIMVETSGSETVLQVNEADADVGILAILEHAAEEVREDHFIPRAENEHAKETAEDSQKDGKGVSIGHDVYSLLSGFNRVFPDNVVRLRRAKVTTGTLMRRMEERKQEEERQIELRRDAARKAKERRKTELWEQQKLANSMTKIHKK